MPRVTENWTAARRAVFDGSPTLGRGEHQIVLGGRAALIDHIERHAGPGIDPRVLRCVAIAGLFADTVSEIASSSTAPKLIACVNQQLAEAGLVVAPLPRN